MAERELHYDRMVRKSQEAWHNRFGEAETRVEASQQPVPMTFRPQTGEVVAHSAEDLVRHRIQIPESVVANQWGSTEGQRYTELMRGKNNAAQVEVFNASAQPRNGEQKISTYKGVQDPNKMAHFVDPYTGTLV